MSYKMQTLENKNQASSILLVRNLLIESDRKSINVAESKIHIYWNVQKLKCLSEMAGSRSPNHIFGA